MTVKSGSEPAIPTIEHRESEGVSAVQTNKADSLMLRGREGRRWRRSRRWNSVQAKVSLTVAAPREELVQMYLDYERWTQRFPETFRDVRLLRQDSDRILVQIDHG